MFLLQNTIQTETALQIEYKDTNQIEVNREGLWDNSFGKGNSFQK